MAGVHEDFGEKIGGAKKDLWKDRGLYADDLEEKTFTWVVVFFQIIHEADRSTVHVND